MPELLRPAPKFDRRGLSGPAILQISNYWHPGDWLELNLLPDEDLEALLVQELRARLHAVGGDAAKVEAQMRRMARRRGGEPA